MSALLTQKANCSTAQVIQQNADRLINRILQLVESSPFLSLDASYQGGTDLHELFKNLDEIIGSTSSELANVVLKDVRIAAIRRKLCLLRSTHEANTEVKLARSILSQSSVEQAVSIHMKWEYPNTTIHSLQFKNKMSNRRSCLLVGSGAFPSTALLLLTHTGLSLCCIDKDEERCLLGQQVVHAAGYREVRFETQDVFDITDFSEWDTIFISAQAGVESGHSVDRTRELLIRHIADSTQPDTLMIFRTPFALGRLIYPEIDPRLLGRMVVTEVQAPVQNRSSLLLIEHMR